MDLGAALLGLLIVVVVKVLVMALTAVLLVRLLKVSHCDTEKLWLLIPQQHRWRLRILTWGLILFAVSELACGVEIYVITRSNALLACLHSITSFAAMGLTAVGLLQLFDWKYLHFVDTASPCIALKTCGECTKRQSGVCRFSALPPVATGLLILMSLPVFFASTQRLHADPGFYALPIQSLNDRFDEMLAARQKANPSGTPAEVSAFHLPEEMLFLEFRVLPVLSVLLAAASIACFVARREDLGITVLLFAVGSQAYVFFEVMIYGLTQKPIFGFFLHESGELFFLAILSILLPRMFPDGRIQGTTDEHG